MKRILQIAALVLLVTLGGSWRNSASAQVDVGISYQQFYDDLSPYGEWIDYPEYGYVWVPSAGPDFRPYSTNGHWVWSDEYEWLWVSDYSWGWAPFHYGRWTYDPLYGWMWVPGYEWAPAWVAWRDGGDYYGWAPLRPGFSINISIGSYNPPVDYWCFAPHRYISSPHIGSYYIDRSRNVTIINNTTIINNYSRRNNTFVSGPRRIDAERYAGRINPVRFREASSPGRERFRSNEVSLYRPRVQQDNNRQFTPRNFERYDRNRAGGGARDNAVRNGNNLPGGRDRNDNSRFDRENNNDARSQGNNNGGRLERGNRLDQRNDQPTTNPGQNGNTDRRRGIFQRNNNSNNGGGSDDNRRFDNRDGFGRGSNQPRTEPNQTPTMERRPNIFERNNNGNNNNNPAPQNNGDRRMRRSVDQPAPSQPGNDQRNGGFGRNRDNSFRQQQQQQQRMERQSQPQQRMERQQPQPQQRMERQQPQPRQFDRGGNNGGGREQRGGGDNGRGRRR